MYPSYLSLVEQVAEVGRGLDAENARGHQEADTAHNEADLVRETLAGYDLEPVVGDFEGSPRVANDLADNHLCKNILRGGSCSSC